MIEKELKKMSRSELLELLLDQAETNKLLQKELDELREKLNQREIAISNSGSIAEASLKLNGVFDAAENAVQQYIENVKLQFSQQEEAYNRIIEEAQNKADTIIAEAEEYARHIRSDDNVSSEREANKQEESIEKSADKNKVTDKKSATRNNSNNKKGKSTKKSKSSKKGKKRKHKKK